jgi:hypothetical protein
LFLHYGIDKQEEYNREEGMKNNCLMILWLCGKEWVASIFLIRIPLFVVV